MRVKNLRLARGWSQAHLAELSGLSIRTIQRIENGANPGLESMRGLAAVFGVEVADLQPPDAGDHRVSSFRDAVVHCLRQFDDFTGTATRAEFWWFALAATLAASIAAAIGPGLSAGVGVVAFLPLAAAATRRLRDAGQSPWWLRLILAPIGGLVAVGFLLAMPTVPQSDGVDVVAAASEPS